jgi:putative ABC transport system permease protein
MNYPKDLTNEDFRNLHANWKKHNPNIVDVMATSQLPDQVASKEINAPFYRLSVDPYFTSFFDLAIVQGRTFGLNDGDSVFMVNEKGLETLGGNTQNVIGVIRDMSAQFNQPEKPIKLFAAPYYAYNFLCVRILEVDIRQTVQYLSGYFSSETVTPVSFMNKRFEEWLKYQDRLNTLSELLAIISALLSCCAIYGLSVSLVRDKLKQIAIHKLLGATTSNITVILVREFARQLVVALLIFGPFTFIFVNELLRNFVYATHFNWLDPILPIAYCATVIMVLCGFQALSLSRTDLSFALKG